MRELVDAGKARRNHDLALAMMLAVVINATSFHPFRPDELMRLNPFADRRPPKKKFLTKDQMQTFLRQYGLIK